MMPRREDRKEWLEGLIRECRSSDSLFHEDGQVVEVELLLFATELAALESAARYHSQTVGQTIRQIVRDFLNQSMDEWPQI
jgi:hypothetical protein